MGIFDALTNLSPEQNTGMLTLGLKLMSQDPTKPTNWSGAVEAGMQATNDARKRKYLEEQLALQTKLMGYQLQDAESDFNNQELGRERNARILKRLQGLPGLPQLNEGQPLDNGGAPTAGPGPSSFMPQMAAMGNSAPPPGQFGGQSALPGSASIFAAGNGAQFPATMGMSGLPGLPGLPKRGGADPMQEGQQPGGQQLPFLPPTMRQAGAAPRQNMTQVYVQRLMEQADVYATEGDFEGASKRYEAAQKMMPQVDRIDIATHQGQPVRVITYKNGQEEISQFGAKPDMVDLDLGGTRQMIDKNRTPAGTVFTKTPTFADRNANARLQLERQQANGSDAGPLTVDAITNAAARYNIDGTLPPMGMGKAGSQGRAAILNKAAEMAAAQGLSGTDQRYAQLNNRGDVAARNSAVRSFATGKDGQAVQSANTALNHLETIRTLAEAQMSGNVKAFNQAARAIGAQFGMAAPTNLNAALIMVAPEVSKAVIGAGGTGHERDEAIKALNPNGSPDQIIGATQTMQELFGGRLTEAKRTYERTTKQTDFDTTMLSPAARNVLTRAQQHGGGSGSVMAAMPRANASNKGRTLVEHETGKRYRSNGLQWVEVK